MITRALWLAFIALLAAPPAPADDDAPPGRAYIEATKKLNEEHSRRPAKNQEATIAKRVPPAARESLDKLLAAQRSPAVLDTLAASAEAALNLDLIEDFERIMKRLEKDSPDRAAKVGWAISRPRYLLRGMGGIDREYLDKFAGVLDAVFAAYDELFGFKEWSKLPGKKVRVRVRIAEKPTETPHFAPQHPYHSEIDFPVQDGKELHSPTPDGKFLFYGLCHELGHLIAMWGDTRREEDHHAWAHYTGLVVVEHLTGGAKQRPEAVQELNDVRWRSVSIDRKRLEEQNQKPSVADRDGVLALFIALHDKLGAKAIGDAINLLDQQGRNQRMSRVRYYRMADFKAALLAGLKKPDERKAVEELFSQP